MKIRMLAVALLCLVSAGCRPYNTPIFEDIDTSETAFLVSLSPTGDDSTKFSEIADIQKAKVNVKKVQLERIFVQKGRLWFTGEYMNTTRLIKVNRAPITVNWSNKEGIWVESKDSIGFSTGIAMTACIMNDEDAIRFLHRYPSGSLDKVLNHEVKAQVQRVFANEAAKENINDLREHKGTIIDAIEAQVLPFFTERGITITSLGQFGGFEYENPKIQEAIDKIVQAQQDKDVATAEANGARERKESLKLLGEGEASKALEIAKGEAEAIKLKADAKEYEVKKASDPQYIALKQLELQLEHVRKWDGRYPTMMMGDTKGIMMTMPMPSK